MFRAMRAKAGSRSTASLITRSARPRAMRYGLWVPAAASPSCGSSERAESQTHKLAPIRDQEDAAERKQHASGGTGRVMRPEGFQVIVRKALPHGICFEDLEKRPQPGSPVPLQDGLGAGQDVEILGGPQIQARGGGGQHVV